MPLPVSLVAPRSLQEAFANIGTTILNSVVGGLVRMGIEWVRGQLMGQAAAAASLASTIAQATAAASAWAPAAMSAIATMGSALLLLAELHMPVHCWLQRMAVAGARLQRRAACRCRLWHRVGGGKPEIFQASNGSQYMIPGDNGR